MKNPMRHKNHTMRLKVWSGKDEPIEEQEKLYERDHFELHAR